MWRSMIINCNIGNQKYAENNLKSPINQTFISKYDHQEERQKR